MSRECINWGTHLPIMEGIMKEWFRKKNKKMLKTISYTSSFHFHIFKSCAKRIKFSCQCDSETMRKNKVKDACREWQGDDPVIFGLTGWGWEEYFRNLRRVICKDCYKSHWHGVRYRTLNRCLK